MKRQQKTYPKIKPISPLILWRKCTFCGMEFKRENGFKIVYLDGSIYCCNCCAKNENEVAKKIEERRHKSNEELKKWRYNK